MVVAGVKDLKVSPKVTGTSEVVYWLV